jgi:hypothetical protein
MLSGAMLAAVITPYNVLVVFKSGLFGTVILMTDVLSGIKAAISKLPDWSKEIGLFKDLI